MLTSSSKRNEHPRCGCFTAVTMPARSLPSSCIAG